MSQEGYRGSGMDQIQSKGAIIKADVPAPPYVLTPPAPGAPTAGQTYQNVRVLSNASADEFNYTMAAITQWIAPKEGCNYCHNPENMASDEKYTKIVARRMIQMTQSINSGWSSHVKQTGVTCWTCHRGNAVPVNHWTMPGAAQSHGMAAVRNNQNDPTATTAYMSLPSNFAALFLQSPAGAGLIRVQSTGQHPSPANTRSVMATEPTYALMNHMSQSLGVNCTFCHNTQSFQSWSLSRPQRATAWYGLRMVGHINQDYISSLAGVFPANRVGPNGDPFKANCATCHQGQNKPLGGVPMSKDYPALRAAPIANVAPMGAPAAPAADKTPVAKSTT